MIGSSATFLVTRLGGCCPSCGRGCQQYIHSCLFPFNTFYLFSCICTKTKTKTWTNTKTTLPAHHLAALLVVEVANRLAVHPFLLSLQKYKNTEIQRNTKTSPQAKRHKLSLLFTSLTILTTLDFIQCSSSSSFSFFHIIGKPSCSKFT